MRKLFLVLGIFALSLSAEAQRPTTSVQLVSNSTPTAYCPVSCAVPGRITPGSNDLIGAGASYWTYCVTSGVSSLQLVAEESPDGNSAHTVPVSVVYGIPISINGNLCAVIQAGGLFAYPDLNVLAISGGTISIWYSASTGITSTFPPAANSSGATTPIVCDKNLVNAGGLGTTTVILISSSSIAGQRIYVCGMTLSFTATPSGNGFMFLYYGTGSTCSVSQVALWEATVTASTPQTYFIGGNVFATVPPGYNLCFSTTSVAPAVDIALAYAQL